MIKLTSLLVLALVLQSTYTQRMQLGAEDKVIASGAAGNFYNFEIPASELGSAREYGYSFWYRAQYAAPVPENWGLIHGAWGGLAGMTENPAGNYNAGGVGDRCLAMWLANGAHVPAQGVPTFHTSSYQMNNGNPWQDLKFPDREDFDWSWNFVYASYSYDLNKARFFVYFSKSDVIKSTQWNDNNKRWPIPKLTFRLGPSHPGEQAAVSSRYQNVRVYWGTGSFVLDDSAFTVKRLADPNTVQPITTNRKIYNVIGESPIQQGPAESTYRASFYEGLDGVEEYSIYGWARWQATPAKGAWHLLYRLSPFRQAEMGNAEKLGDRDLVCWVGAGYLHTSTSSFNYYGGHDQNLWKNTDYGSNLESWFFFYQGYSFSQKKVVFYVKWQNSENSQVWENVWHQKPDYMTLLLGNDQWHGSFSGQLKHVNVHFGPGAFRADSFADIYTPGMQVAQPTNLRERTEPGEVIESPERVQPAYKFSVPAAELGSINSDYAYAFWYRANFFYPVRSNLGIIRGQYVSLAILTETGNQGGALGDRTAAIWFAPQNTNDIINHVSTYDVSPANGNHWRNVKLPDNRDHDSYWNFVYFGHSRDLSKSFYCQYASRSGQSVSQEWTEIQHTFPKAAFHFILGGSQFSSINGHYYNPQFWYTGQSFLGTVAEVDNFRTQRMTAPKVLLTPTLGRKELVASAETAQAPNSAKRNLWISNEPAGAQEYAIYGWYKWSHQAMQTWSSLFRVSMVGKADGSDLGNADKQGDRTFCIWANPDGNVYPATYVSGLAGTDNWNWYVSMPYQDDLESWFWVYFGYSHETHETVAYFKWQDRETKHIFPGSWHKVPYYFMITVGGEGVWYNGWNGQIKNVNFVWGPGSFRNGNYESLTDDGRAAQIAAENGVEQDNTWTNEPNAFVSEQEKTICQDDLLEVAVPAADVPNVREYSMSFWFRFSYTDPGFINIGRRKANYMQIAGVTENENYHGMAVGDRAMALWFVPENNGLKYHATTYASNTGNNNVAKNLPFADASDYDSTWNFVYMGYSYNQQKVVFYSKFGKSNTALWETWDQISHRTLTNRLKFQLGKARESTSDALNGRYFDVRFRYDNLAFKGSQANVEWYLANSVKSPTPIAPIGTIALTNKLVRRTQEDDFVQKQIPNELNGARQYGIYGWAKWEQPRNLAPWNNLFRVTILPTQLQNDCCDRLGSRTIAVWWKPDTKFLHFTQYKIREDENGNAVDNKPTNEAESWFWIYQAVDIDQKKVVQYARFASGDVYVNVRTNHLQYVPRSFEIYFGRDKYYSGWNGQLKGWNFVAGEGAFREADFDKLYTKPSSQADNDLNVGGAGDNQLFNSNSNPPQGDNTGNGPVFSQDIPDEEITDVIKPSAWVWFNWNFKAPTNFGNVAKANNQCFSIHRIKYTVTKGLAADLCFDASNSPSVRFTDRSSGEPVSASVPLDDEDLDNWNFVYLHHDDAEKKSYGAIKLGKNGRITFKELGDRNWNLPSDRCGLRVSGDDDGAKKFNGYFFDAQLAGTDAAGAKNSGQLEAVAAQVTVHPDSANDDADQEDQDAERVHINDNAETLLFVRPRPPRSESNPENPNSLYPTKNLGNLAFKKSYGLIGYAKWNKDTRAFASNPTVWTQLYRQIQTTHEDAENIANPGDRTFAVYFNREGKIYIETYDYKRGQYTQKVVIKDINLDLLNDWFLVYHGYSSRAKKTYFMIKFSDGTVIEQADENIRHIRSKNNFLYLGRDKFQGHGDWNGLYRGFQALIGGANSFAETPEDVQAFADYLCTPPVVDHNDAVVSDGINDDGEGELAEVPEHLLNQEDPADQVLTGELLPAEGDCVIMYTECNFKGRSYQACEHVPDTDVVVKSLYVPEGWTVTLYDDEQYQGRKSVHSHSEQCLDDSVQFTFLINKEQSISKLHKQKSGRSQLKKNRQ